MYLLQTQTYNKPTPDVTNNCTQASFYPHPPVQSECPNWLLANLSPQPPKLEAV